MRTSRDSRTDRRDPHGVFQAGPPSSILPACPRNSCRASHKQPGIGDGILHRVTQLAGHGRQVDFIVASICCSSWAARCWW